MKRKLQYCLLMLGLLLISGFTNRLQNTDKLLMEQICANRPLLKETLVQAGLSPMLMDNGPYTFFAPSDEALAKYQNGDPGKLKNALMNHLVAGKFLKEDFKDGSKITTMGGTEISVFRKGNKLLINGALVTEPDMVAKNGVMHTVDNWLVVP